MQRPTAVTVFGILNIGFAVLGIVGALASVMLFLAVGATSSNPVVQIIRDSPAYAAWMKISIVLGVSVSAILLAAGIGLLQLKPWARIVSIIYSIYTIVMVLVGGVINCFFLVQPMLQQAHQHQGPEATGAAIGGAIGGMFGSCFGLIYPIVLLIFMTRANIVAAFQSSAPPSVQP
jgi:hypothetical protein